MDELADELGVDPLEIREKNWIKHEEFPFTTVCGLEYDSGNYEAATARAKEIFGYDALRAEQKQRRESQRPGPARHRRLHLHRDVRPRALPGAGQPELRRRRLGARVGPDAADRQGRGRHRLVRARPGPRDGLVARSSPTGSASPFEDVEVLHGDTAGRAQGHGHLRLALAGRRWRGAGQGRRQGDREGQADRGPPARGLASTTSSSRPAGSASRAPTRACAMARDRAGDLRGAQPARRDRADARLRRDVRPGELLLPARHAPVRGRDRHRDRWR